jgi:UDP-N-acetylmuramoyl-tripeptide--D-alanyl-D-alanine ligase
LASAAKARGCQVKSFLSPYAAGEFVKELIKSKAIVLAEGSQNGVFAEESLKVLLANPADKDKLVRQSDYWLNIKRKQFTDSTI